MLRMSHKSKPVPPQTLGQCPAAGGKVGQSAVTINKFLIMNRQYAHVDHSLFFYRDFAYWRPKRPKLGPASAAMDWTDDDLQMFMLRHFLYNACATRANAPLRGRLPRVRGQIRCSLERDKVRRGRRS